MSQPPISITQEQAQRECGGCTVCCTAIAVQTLGKPTGRSCQHLIQTGCGIYPQRLGDPAYVECEGFRCLWLQGHLDEGDRPDKVKIVFYAVPSPDPRKQGMMIIGNEIAPGAVASNSRGEELIFGLTRTGMTVLVRNALYATQYTQDGRATRMQISRKDPLRVEFDRSSPPVQLTIGGRKR